MIQDLRFPGRSDMLSTISAATDVSPPEVIDKLKKIIFKKRIRLREFFQDFDSLRSGVLPVAKFYTAMATAGLSLSPPDMHALASYFADPKDTKRFQYEAMLDEIEQIFTTSNMETDPSSTVTDFTPTLKREDPLLSPEETAACRNLIGKLAHLVKTRQIDVRPTFDDGSKNINSTLLVDQVTAVQFRNGLSSLGLPVNAEETAMLCKAFAGEAEGYVNYIAFCCAIDPALQTFSAREPRSYVAKPLKSGFRYPIYHEDGTPDQPGRAPVTFNQPKLPVQYAMNPQLSLLMAKLQLKASVGRLPLLPFFFDFDKHRDGTVTQPEFVKQLGAAYDKMGLGLSEEEMDLLLEHYSKTMKHGARHVCYRNFIADVEKVFTTTGMEKDPGSIPSYVRAEQKPVTLTPSREEAVHKLLADLRKRVEVRRVLVKPLFNDFGDWSHSTKIADHITRQNMLQALSRFGIEISMPQAELLYDRYDTLNLGTVNYIALVRDIDPYESFSGRAQTLHAFPQDPEYGTKATLKSGFRKDRVVGGPVVNLQPGRPPTSNDHPMLTQPPPQAPVLTQLLARMQQCAVTHRLRVQENFKDFDRHRDGTITIPQYQSCLAMTFGKHLPLSQKEVEVLQTAYGVRKSGAVHVNWKLFCKDVDAVFQMPGLEKVPTATPPPLIAQLPRPKASLSAAEEREVMRILQRFRTRTSDRRMLVKPFFSDAEYNRNTMRVVDHVTKSQFAQVLSRLSFEATTAEVDLLCRKYDDKGDGFVNYVDFSVAVDTAEEGSDREKPERDEVTLFRANGNFKATKTGLVQPGRAPLVANTPGLLSQRADAANLGELMRRLQEKAMQNCIPVHDFFSDYDKHKYGAISRPQFRRGLNAAFGVSYIQEAATEAELNHLEDVYATEVLDGELFVSWKLFCDHITNAKITPGLEKTPTVTPQPIVPSMGHTIPTLSPDKEYRVQQLLNKMRKRFDIRCVYVKAPFHDFAKSNNSPMMIDHVTRQQFVQGLNRFDISLQEADLALLFEKYNDRGDGSVNYVAFSTDVDPTETFSTRERLPAFSPEMSTSKFSGGFRESRVHEDLLR